MRAFTGMVDLGDGAFDARVSVRREGLALTGGTREAISFADIMDMRLQNYRVRLSLRESDVWISKLGYQTEDFFEQVWMAYAARSRESLFVNDKPAMVCEGDYAYAEPDGSAHGIAKLEIFEDCLCLHPHNVGARRVPLCFADMIEREGFRLSLTLDTGETYQLARLGRDTEGFFDCVMTYRKRTRARWEKARQRLNREFKTRLRNTFEHYRAFETMGLPVNVGLFSPDTDEFWFVVANEGRAAVELVCAEDAATYLYRYRASDDEFVLRLRHAMEAVRKNRRIIFMDEAEVSEVPLYRMALDRCAHMRFLRESNAGRIIHSKGWETRLRAFFGDTNSCSEAITADA